MDISLEDIKRIAADLRKKYSLIDCWEGITILEQEIERELTNVNPIKVDIRLGGKIIGKAKIL